MVGRGLDLLRLLVAMMHLVSLDESKSVTLV